MITHCHSNQKLLTAKVAKKCNKCSFRTLRSLCDLCVELLRATTRDIAANAETSNISAHGRNKLRLARCSEGNESSVIGGEHLSLIGATLLNGYLITAVTMCDVHRATMTHITPEIVPPALAIAERDDLVGSDLLVAVAAGCEVTTRIGIGLDYPAFRARGWHGRGVIGPFGAAASVGSLLKFDADAMARAFGLAGSQAAGTYAAWGTPTVKFHQCRGAISGLLAALLAQQNFVASDPVPEVSRWRRSVCDSRQQVPARAPRKAEWFRCS